VRNTGDSEQHLSPGGDHAGISKEATNDAAWAIMRAWYAVQDHGGWPEAPATKNLPPPPPALTMVREAELGQPDGKPEVE